MLVLALAALMVGWLTSFGLNYKEVYKEYGSRPLKEIINEADSLVVDNPEKALALYAIIIGSYEAGLGKNDLNIVASAYNNAGYVYYFEYSDYVQAYDYFLHGIELAQKTDTHNLLPPAYINMGNIHSAYNEPEVAVGYYCKAMTAAYDVEDWQNMMNAAFNLISHVYLNDKNDSVIEVLKVLEDSKIPPTEMLNSNRLFMKSYLSRINGNLDEAINLLKQSRAQIDSKHYPERFANLLQRNEGSLYLQQNDYSHALQSVKQSRVLAAQHGHLDLESFSDADLSEIYQEMGRKDSADYYKLLSLEISDSLFNTTKYGSIRDLKASFDMRRANQALQDMMQKRRTHILILTIISIAFVVILGLLIRMYVQNRRLRERNLHIYKQMQEKLKFESSENHVSDESEPEDSEPEEKYKGSQLKDDDKQRLYAEIMEILKTHPEVYAPDFTIDRLAALVNCKSRYVSQVINELAGKNFNALLSEQRIQEACRRFNDPKIYGKLTIEGIALDLGFKSRSNFATLFKKVTGLTPREYQKIAANRLE